MEVCFDVLKHKSQKKYKKNWIFRLRYYYSAVSVTKLSIKFPDGDILEIQSKNKTPIPLADIISHINLACEI